MKEWTISAVHDAMAKGELTCLQLVQYYLERIKKYDDKTTPVAISSLKQYYDILNKRIPNIIEVLSDVINKVGE